MTRKTKAPLRAPDAFLEYPTVLLSRLKEDPKNPRVITNAELEILERSMFEFGFVEPVVARPSDGLIMGGHQRRRAYLALYPKLKLLIQFTVRISGGTITDEDFGAPRAPVMWRELDDQRARMLNLALNRIGGTWDADKLPQLIESLTTQMPLEALMVTGFTAAELTDFADLASNPVVTTGDAPVSTPRAPHLSFDFSSEKKRDAVKRFIAARVEKGKKTELGGDLLAKLLGVR